MFLEIFHIGRPIQELGDGCSHLPHNLRALNTSASRLIVVLFYILDVQEDEVGEYALLKYRTIYPRCG